MQHRNYLRRDRLLLASLCALAAGLGCKVHPPSAFERALAAQVKRRITVGGKGEQSPLPVSAENIREGQKAFSYYCVSCHGRDGQKTDVPFADRMSPPVPSLASPEVQAYSDGQLKWIIDNGLYPSGMPASNGSLNDEEIWKIVQFLRHLPPAGSLAE